MGQHVVARNESLWSIAKQHVGARATNTQIARAVKALAEANGLATDAQLRAGQSLTLPDAFERGPQGTAAREARQRLQTAPATGSTQAALRAKPLVAIDPVFSPVGFSRGADVTLAPIAGVAPKAHELHMTSVRSTSVHETALRSLHVELGTLTQAQFDAVHRAFGGRSAVKFDPARSYLAQDFLPPALQALLHQDLEIGEPIELKGSRNVGEDFGYGRNDKHVYFTMNCHATAWEAMRAYQGASLDEVAVFYGEMVLMDALTQDASFALVGEVKSDRIADLLTLDLKPGDVVHFHQDNGFMRASTNLLHSAVYVGGGLFFEKPNTEGPEKEDRARYVVQDETPFRLATLELMTTPVGEAAGGAYRVEVRRPSAPLQDAADAFDTTLQKELEAWAKKKGRTLGVEVVPMYEQGMGGNIRGEDPSALVRVKLAQNDDGTHLLATR